MDYEPYTVIPISYQCEYGKPIRAQVTGVCSEYLGPGTQYSTTNTLYDGQMVYVYALADGYPRVTRWHDAGLYDDKVNGYVQRGNVARWIPVEGLIRYTPHGGGERWCMCMGCDIKRN